METIDKEAKYEFDKAMVKWIREQIEEDRKQSSTCDTGYSHHSIKDAMDKIKKDISNLVKLNTFQFENETCSIEFQILPKAVRTIIIDKLEDGTIRLC